MRERLSPAEIVLLRRQRRRNHKKGPLRLILAIALLVMLGTSFLATTALASGVGAVAAVYAYFAKDLPAPESIGEQTSAFKTTKIYDRNGHLLYEIFDPHGGKRTTVPLSEMPKFLRDATIASEDKDFYINPGIDYRGLIRAGMSVLGIGDVRLLVGGSSITQQLVKNVLIPPEERGLRVGIDAYNRKAKEIILALEITRRYSKDQILEMYLNEIYYGNMAYGVEAAAESYFGKQAKDLSLAESAMLAALPQAPAWNSPLTNPEQAKKRQAIVLDAMAREGYITPEQAFKAKNEKLRYASQKEQFGIEAPHFVFYVRDLLEKKYGADLVTRGGLTIITTMDLDMQKVAERVAREKIQKLAKENNAHNAALVAIDPRNGEILTMLGSVDYYDKSIDGQVNVAISERQPGSSFKPFAYVTAFAKGWTPATMVMDVRTSFDDSPNPPYIPENVDGKWRGPLRLRNALAYSENVPAVKVTQYAGVADVIAMAHRLGITTLNREGFYGLSITLGGGEVKLLDEVYAFGVFANNGVMAGQPRPFQERMAGHRELDPAAILKVMDSDGNVIDEYKEPQRKEVLKPQLAYLINSILSDNAARSAFFGWNSPLKLSRPAAAKTGTTTDWRDNWTVGYTPDLATGVWVGNSNNQPMRQSYGSTAAAPIWNAFMEEVLKGKPILNFQEPPGMERKEVCAVSGQLPTRYCPNKTTEIFIKGTAPTTECTVHQAFKIDKANGKLATAYTPPEDIEEKVFEIYPPEAADWVRENKIPQPPTEYSERNNPNPTGGDVAIISPKAFSYVTQTVPIVGNAKGDGFQFYQVEFGEGLNPPGWTPIGPSHSNQVDNGQLETWDTSGIKDGLYSLQLSVMRNGNFQRASVPVTVDRITPTVKIAYPYNNEAFTLQPGNPANLRIQADAADNARMDRVEFYLDGRLVGMSTVAPYNIMLPLASPGLGGHSIYAIALDAAGNQTKSAEVKIRIILEQPKPK